MGDSIFKWLLAQQPLGWVLFFATWIGFFLMIAFDKLHTGGQMDRERERDKETIERQDAAINKKDGVIEELVAARKQSLENDKLIIRLVRSLQEAARKQGKP